MDETPGATLGRLIVGFQVSQAIHVAATVGVADLLADGPRTSDELAAATNAHPGSLYRLLRALASVGVFHEDEGRGFTLTPMGALLRSDVPGSLRGWAVYVGRPYFREAWGHLEHSVRTGDNAFQHVHGTDVWSYRAELTDESGIFDLAMESLTGASNRALLDAYDFGRFESVVDVGGGNGTLLAALLGEFRAMRGVLLDQPHVVANAAAAVLERAGVADRCEIVGGSFFDEVPTGGDAYTLKSIIHDYEDERAVAILRVCRRAMAADATLFLIDRIVGPPNEDPRTKFSDLNMLVTPAGRERTLHEWDALVTRAGFRLATPTPSTSGLAVIEAAPVIPD
jgi:O-methyltransferase/methyltransferase family protein